MIFLAGLLLMVLGIQVGFHLYGEKHSLKEDKPPKDVDAIFILGARVFQNQTPSPMLQERLEKGLYLYQQGFAPKVIVSGDNGQKTYNEVQVMKEFLKERGVPKEDIFMDHAGFSTYDSIYRAKAIFGAQKVILVTQAYHLKRALYLSKQLGLSALGAPADQIEYHGQWKRECREILARVKDFWKGILRPKPKYLGPSIDLKGDGRVSWD